MQSLVELITNTHDYLFEKIADERVKDWPLMSNPYLLLSIIYCYLAFTLKYGPQFMRDRQPYSLKSVIQLYNVAKILTSFYLFYQFTTTTYIDAGITLGCEPIDYSPTPINRKILTLVWYAFLQKLSDMIETVLFILRKKNKQVSFLHVYHHVSTVGIVWLTTKYVGGGMAIFPIALNELVHIIMYTYYYLASLGPSMQKRIHKWKKFITRLQMVQFCIILLYSAQAIPSTCNIPKFIVIILIPNVLLVFYLFYDFYRKSYIKKQERAQKGLIHTKKED